MGIIPESARQVNPYLPPNRPVRPQTPKPVPRPRLVCPPEGDRPGLFVVFDGQHVSDYQLEPIGSAWGAAFKVTKLAFEGPEAEYHVLIDTERGEHSCECPGWLRWGHRGPCRHVAALLAFVAAGQLTCRTVAPEQAPEYPEYLGDEAVEHTEPWSF